MNRVGAEWLPVNGEVGVIFLSSVTSNGDSLAVGQLQLRHRVLKTFRK